MRTIKTNQINIATTLLLLLFSIQTYGMDTVKHIIHNTEKEIEKLVHYTEQELDMLADFMVPGLEQMIHSTQGAIAHNPYKDIPAQVRYGMGISKEEDEFRQKRFPFVHAALEKSLNQSLEQEDIPFIAFVFSGGGYRALLYAASTLHTAQQMGLLDTVMYMIGLSGSAWAIAPWVSTGMPIKDFREYIKKCIAKPFHDVTHEEKLLIANMIAVEKTYKRPQTLVNIYGALLANRLLEEMGDKRQMTYLSDQAAQIADARIPYPIYTATDGRESAEKDPDWYIYTPHEIGFLCDNIHVPTFAHGRTFKKGNATNNAPEETLGMELGTIGSAFAADLHTAWKEAKKSLADPLHASKEFEHLFIDPIGKKRVLPFWGKEPSFLYKVKDHKSCNRKHVKLVDAGLTINLPYPAVSGVNPERMASIQFYFDASAGEIGNELKKAEEYAHKKCLKFPHIDYTNIKKKTLSVFKDEHDKTVPMIFYVPRISDHELWEQNRSKPEFAHLDLSDFDFDTETQHGFCATKNFQYTLQQSEKVMQQIEFNMLVNKEKIFEAIAWKINQQKL